MHETELLREDNEHLSEELQEDEQLIEREILKEA